MTFSDIQFTNEQITVNNLPSIEHLDYKGLHKDYLTAELIGTSIFTVFIAIGGISFLIFNTLDLPMWTSGVIIALILAVILFIYWITLKSFHHKQYALRTHDISYKEGLWWKQNTVIPFNRIQHVEVQQGPIQRLFDLAKIKIYTAGGSTSDLSISGLYVDTAHKLKHYIINKASLDEEE